MTIRASEREIQDFLHDYGWYVRDKIQERDHRTVMIPEDWGQAFARHKRKTGDVADHEQAPEVRRPYGAVLKDIYDFGETLKVRLAELGYEDVPVPLELVQGFARDRALRKEEHEAPAESSPARVTGAMQREMSSYLRGYKAAYDSGHATLMDEDQLYTVATSQALKDPLWQNVTLKEADDFLWKQIDIIFDREDT